MIAPCSDADKILVLGASSYVGRHLLRRLAPEKTIATYNRQPIPSGIRFDSLTMPIGAIIPDPAEIAHAVILLGDTQPDSCIANPVRSRAVNVDSTKRIIDTLSDWGIPIIFPSTEFMFDGIKGEYTEEEPPSPILLYGKQKLEIERYLKNNAAAYTILRMAKIYGDRLDDGTFFSGWLKALLRGDMIRCATDQRFSPVHVEDIVDVILAVMGKRLHGLYHVAGPIGGSRIEFLNCLVTEVRRFLPKAPNIVPCSIHDFKLPERRPVDVTMVVDKLVTDTGLRLRHPTETCRRLSTLVS
jgi:dTDP-4-dehydrorhamnose reductase